MTDGTSPSAILVAAADRIRDLAAAATPGQWAAKDMRPHGYTVTWYVETGYSSPAGASGIYVAELEQVNATNDAKLAHALCPELVEEDQK